MKENKTCAVCYGKYLYCPNCKKDEDKPTWMFVFCSENCHDIYETTSDYNTNKITAKQAKDKLDKLDLSKLDDFGESYRKAIAEINETTRVAKNKKTVKAVKMKGDLVNDSTEVKENGKVDVE